MNLLLPYDTETTGLPDWKTPSGGVNQPHLVQIAGMLVDAGTRKVIQSIDLIIRPHGWDIPKEASDVHGITTEYAMDVGVSEAEALEAFLAMWAMGRAQRIAFNKTFDQRIIRIATKRYLPEEIIERWAEKDDHHCAMKMAREVIGGKTPKLTEAYKFFTGNDMADNHTAMPDAEACMAVYWGALDSLESQQE